MWEKVAWGCLERIGDKFCQDSPVCKSKFDMLHFKKCPTGTNEIPVHIARVKKIKEKFDQNKVIGSSILNNSILGNKEMYNDDVFGTSNLCDEEGKVKQPKTKKIKTQDVATAIENLATKQLHAAEEKVKSIALLTPSKENGVDLDVNKKSWIIWR